MPASWNRVRSSLSRAGQAAAGAGRGTVRAGRAAVRGTAHAGRTAAEGTARAGRGVRRATRRLTYAQGAGRTGLGRLIELTAAHSAGDALITVGLAGTLLFGLPVDQARGQVAIYLLITMVPFTVVAPFVGPVLDRFRSGRRYVMAGTLFARGLLCWAMAAAIGPGDGLTLFPAALAVLVLSKAYNVSRAATMPSVLPADITLVTANARVALFSLVSAALAAPVAVGLAAWPGADWLLRGTMVIFLAAGVVAVRLPPHVDAPDLDLDAEPDRHLAGDPAGRPDGDAGGHLEGDRGRGFDLDLYGGLDPDLDREPGGDERRNGPESGPESEAESPAEGARRGRSRRRWRTLLNVGPVVGEAVRANAAIRVLSGFLLFFLLFLVQDGNLRGSGLPEQVMIAILAGGAGVGGLAGAGVASWVRGRSPALIVLLALALGTVTTAAGAFFFSLWTAVAVAAVAGFAQEIGKLALDATVQREIGEEVRSSTFGVVEALLQIAWVGGGLAGLLLSLLSGRSAGPIGLTAVAAALVAALAWLVVARRRRLRARTDRIRAARVPRTPAPASAAPRESEVPEPSARDSNVPGSSTREPNAPGSPAGREPSGRESTGREPSGRESQAPAPKPGATKPLTNPHG
ncbi:MFS transporter [Sphaerisporangium perillae]|uniref:MFS transporter n=1 Tax=Sphaerisporangium perillae TaxID=2935860 RepID=UPI00200DA2CC|nr:MFS transporter [Sphaerisporangium perillae]